MWSQIQAQCLKRVGDEIGEPFINLEFLKGGPLTRQIRQGKKLTLQEESGLLCFGSERRWEENQSSLRKSSPQSTLPQSGSWNAGYHYSLKIQLKMLQYLCPLGE